MNEAPATRASMRDLIGLISAEKGRLLFSLSITVFAALFELLPYLLLYESLQVAMSGKNVSAQFLQLAAWMAVVLVSKYLLYSVAYYLSHQAAFKLLSQIRQGLARRLVWSPLLWLHQFTSGELKKILMQDVELMEQFIAHHLVEMMAAIVSPLLVTLLLFWLDWRLALAALSVVPLALLAQRLFMRGMDEHFAEFEQANSNLNGAIVEYVRNVAVMKAFQQDSLSFQRLHTSLDHHSDLIRKVTYQTVPGWSVFAVLLSANVFFVLPVGMYLYAEGTLPLSDLVLALVLGSGMLKPLFKVVRFATEIQEILIGVQRILPFLQWPKPQPKSASELKPPITVYFDQVSFSFSETPLLHELTLQLPAACTTALIGPSGAGKSTLAQLLAGIISPSQGRVCLNKTSLAELDDSQRSALVTLASQEAFLFRGSLLENLRLGRPQATIDDIDKALSVAQAQEFVERLPEGLETIVGERGTQLSGGERQRIAIARALLASTPVLILDEATAFADVLTESAFHRALRESYPAKTLLLITHRLQAIEQADIIVVMERGQLVDSGAHHELLERCALYQRLWRRQRDGERWVLGESSADSAATRLGN